MPRPYHSNRHDTDSCSTGGAPSRGLALPVKGIGGELEEPATRLVSKLKAGRGHERANRQSVEPSARRTLSERAPDLFRGPLVYTGKETPSQARSPLMVSSGN